MSLIATKVSFLGCATESIRGLIAHSCGSTETSCSVAWEVLASSLDALHVHAPLH